MDLALFSTDQERELIELVEVEAQTTCQSDEATLLLALYIK